MKSGASLFLRRARTCVFRKRGKVKAEMLSFTTCDRETPPALVYIDRVALLTYAKKT